MGETPFENTWAQVTVRPALPFGLYRCRQHDDFGQKWFADFDLYIGIHGFATVQMLGRTIELVAGRVVLIPPRIPIHLRTDDREPSFMARLHFDLRLRGRKITDGRKLVDPAAMSVRLPGLPPLALVGDHHDGMLGQTLVQAYQTPADDVAQFEAMVKLLEVLHHLRRTFARAGQPGNWDEKLVDHAVTYMQEHLHQPLRLRQVASQAGVSPATLGRLFDARLQTTPMRYLTQLRLAKARELLSNSHMPVKQIGFACGYRSQALFSRVFAGTHSCPPTEYRRSHFGVA